MQSKEQHCKKSGEKSMFYINIYFILYAKMSVKQNRLNGHTTSFVSLFWSSVEEKKEQEKQSEN